MAVPKSKTSKQRKRLRRSNVWRLDTPQLILCPKCGEYKRQHRVCKGCGTYNGRQVIIEKPEKK